MSLEATGWAWTVEGVSPVERLSLLALAESVGAGGYLDFKPAVIARRALCTPAEMEARMAGFVDAGLFVKVTEPVPVFGSMGDVYRLVDLADGGEVDF